MEQSYIKARKYTEQLEAQHTYSENHITLLQVIANKLHDINRTLLRLVNEKEQTKTS